MSQKFLDKDGLQYYTGKIKEYIEGHGGFPAYPEAKGNYALYLTVGDTTTLSWKSIAGVFQLPTQIGNDLQLYQAVTINQINNGLEVR